MLQGESGALAEQRNVFYVFSFLFYIAHKSVGKFSNVLKIIFTVKKLCMFYFSVFIILQDVYGQLIVNIRSSKRVVRYENHVRLMIE